MSQQPLFLMTNPALFEVAYVINPWMQPEQWRSQAPIMHRRSLQAWQALHDGLLAAGAAVRVLEPGTGLPDMVFPANAAVVLDGRVLLSRFARDERRGEEPLFRTYFEQLREAGLVTDIATLPEGLAQEGAGDCLWDERRGLFWAGFGQRSRREASTHIADYFGVEAQPLELVDPRFYHLDVAMAVLERGEVLYYPSAFSAASQSLIRARVPRDLLIAADENEAIAFNLNIVSVNGQLLMTPPSDRLRAVLGERGYHLTEIDLAPFMLAGGAAVCLTLRLDRSSALQPVHAEGDRHDNGTNPD